MPQNTKPITYFLLILLLFSCSKRERTTIDGLAMGIPYKVVIKEAVSKEEIEEIKAIVDCSFKEIDDKLNGWNKDSEIALWNKSTSIEKVPVSDTLLSIIKVCDKAHKISNGVFDPTLGRLTQGWKIALKVGKVLGNEEIELLAPACGWDKLIIGENTLQKKHPDLMLDLDGISKGFFCDLCIERLRSAGYTYILVEWGGEIKALGGPFNILSKGKVIPLTDASIATSGPEYQLYPIDRNGSITIYSHFIAPSSLRPIPIENSHISESIIQESCAMADALATSNFIKNTQSAVN